VTNIYFIRHAEAVVNASQIVGGMRGDTGLTPLGISQAERLRDRLATTREIVADTLVASSLPRARQTAEIIAPALDIPILLDDDLQELRPGEADGLSLKEAMERFSIPDFERDVFRPISPGGESWAQFMFRVYATLDRITREQDERSVVIVTHGGFIDGALLYFFGQNPLASPKVGFSTRHVSITNWKKRKRWSGTEGWHLVVYNDTAHLTPPANTR
jgi:2,3-bisphosphoglycerate-dependent phosphoglycerate mutase